MQKTKIRNWSKGSGPSGLIGFLAFLVVLAVVAGCGGPAADLTDGEYLAVSDSYDHDGWAAYALLRVESGEIDRLEIDRINRHGDRQSEQAAIAESYRSEGEPTPAEVLESVHGAVQPDGAVETERLAELERHSGSFERVLLAVLDAAETAVDEPVVVEAAGDEPVELNEIERLTRVSEEERNRVARRGGISEGGDGPYRYAAVSSHYLATEAAIEVLEDGGTAADAAFTIAAVLTVVEPWFSSILGGGTWALYYDAEADEVRALDGVAGAASGATPEFFAETERYAEYGMHMAIVPGAWAGWIEWLQEYGETELNRLMEPAIEAAEQGVPVSEGMAFWLSTGVDDFAEWPDTAQVYLRDGELPEVGDTVYQPNAAETFRELVEVYEAERASGERAALEAAKDYFYRGPLAERIVEFSEQHGGLYELSDFTEFDDAGFREPIATDYRDLEVYQNPPNSQGITQLIALNILEGLELNRYEPGSAEAIHLQTEAIKLAMADRNRHVADPDAVDVPVEALLSDEHASNQRERISADEALAWPFGDVLADAGDHYTTTFHVVDERGNAAAVTTSLGAQFLVVGDTGIHINNRMRFMHYDRDDPNVTEPGKKVRHTSNPYLAMRDGRPYILGGNTGADFQAQGQLQQFIGVVEHGLTAQEAVSQPRFESLGFPATTYPFTAEGTLALEEGVSEQARQGLAARGHRLEDDGIFGSANMIRILDWSAGELELGVEPREEVSRGKKRPADK